MSADPDEKFYLDYWSFEGETDAHNFNSWTNTSSLRTLEPCVALHTNKSLPIASRHLPFSLWVRSLLDKRDFQCPSGTNACSAIGYPNSCCPTGETCQIVPDTGLGNVGCCPAGETCAGSLSSCSAGQTACPNNPGGGCCIAGYTCLDVGCVYTGTATVVITPVPASTTTLTLTTVITPSVTSASPITVTSTTVLVPVPTTTSTSSSIYTTTTTSTSIFISTSSEYTTTSTTHTTINNEITCSSGYKSCPASLGGGCCPTDRACASGAYCPALSSTNTPNAPYRPTTDTTATTAASSISTTIAGAGCPTGFYACSAYYQGGCCQVGRDCSKTNCPTTASTTLVSGNGITIAAPTGNGISTAILSGVCATGWQSCAATDGGGCCPAGYACGTSCTATASGGGGSVTAKEAPQSGAISMHGTLRLGGIAVLGAFVGAVLL